MTHLLAIRMSALENAYSDSLSVFQSDLFFIELYEFQHPKDVTPPRDTRGSNDRGELIVQRFGPPASRTTVG